MAQVLDWRDAADQRAVVQQAIEALELGQIVALPTETSYCLVANLQLPESALRLGALAGSADDKPPTLLLYSISQLLEWIPALSPIGRRLARRCWPGPVTLLLDADFTTGHGSKLPEATQRLICPRGQLAVRVPAPEAVTQLLAFSPVPLLMTSASKAGGPKALTAAQVQEAFGDDVSLILDAGDVPAGQSSSVVRVEGNRWKMQRLGVISAEEIEKQTACVIVFVCTGNTCRSPMAEALCAKLLAEKLGCSPRELPQRGFIVLSAGMAAMNGDSAAKEAVETARELGADLQEHSSQPLTAELVLLADHLFTMTRAHQAALVARFAPYAPSPRLLDPEGNDIADPIGAELEVYRECARKMLQHLEKLVPDLQPLA